MFDADRQAPGPEPADVSTESRSNTQTDAQTEAQTDAPKDAPDAPTNAPADPEAAQRELRLRRREILLAELAEARALRKRLHPRRARLARERAVLHAATLRR